MKVLEIILKILGEIMLEIIDKLLILIFCITLYIDKLGVENAPVSMIIVIILSCLCTYFENRKIYVASLVLFTILSTFFPFLILFLPLIIYDILYTEDWKYGAIVLVPIIINHTFFNSTMLLLVALLIVLTYLTKYKTSKNKRLLQEYYTYRDSAKEMEILLEEKNHKLLENQDNEIHMATLNERNRISKEIHDNIGHLISRSLIHIGALLTISKEKKTKEGLEVLKSSLSEGMDSIRSSIHNLHDESIDLYAAIDSLVKEFSFCSISFDYNIQTPPALNLKYLFISTIKEALANIMKHSNGTNVSIVLTEHPIMYQLIIYDNGVLSESERSKIDEINRNISKNEGMGLRNIVERVQGFDGIIKFSGEKGFKIFITIPIIKA